MIKNIIIALLLVSCQAGKLNQLPTVAAPTADDAETGSDAATSTGGGDLPGMAPPVADEVEKGEGEAPAAMGQPAAMGPPAAMGQPAAMRPPGAMGPPGAMEESAMGPPEGSAAPAGPPKGAAMEESAMPEGSAAPAGPPKGAAMEESAMPAAEGSMNEVSANKQANEDAMNEVSAAAAESSAMPAAEGSAMPAAEDTMNEVSANKQANEDVMNEVSAAPAAEGSMNEVSANSTASEDKMNEVSAEGSMGMGGNGTDAEMAPAVAPAVKIEAPVANSTMNMENPEEDKGQEEVIMDAIHDVTKVLSSENADELIQLIQGQECDGAEVTDENGNNSFVRANEHGDLIVGMIFRNKCHIDNSCGVEQTNS